VCDEPAGAGRCVRCRSRRPAWQPARRGAGRRGRGGAVLAVPGPGAHPRCTRRPADASGVVLGPASSDQAAWGLALSLAARRDAVLHRRAAALVQDGTRRGTRCRRCTTARTPGQRHERTSRRPSSGGLSPPSDGPVRADRRRVRPAASAGGLRARLLPSRRCPPASDAFRARSSSLSSACRSGLRFRCFDCRRTSHEHSTAAHLLPVQRPYSVVQRGWGR